MSIFKREREVKRMIFNVYADLAENLERLRVEAKRFDKRLDVDAAINKALDKFVKKAEKKIEEMQRAAKDKHHKPALDTTLAGQAVCAEGEDSPTGNTSVNHQSETDNASQGA